jgi:hypothetical protein
MEKLVNWVVAERKGKNQSLTSCGVSTNSLPEIVNAIFGIDSSELQFTSDSPLGLGRRSQTCVQPKCNQKASMKACMSD